MNKKKVWRFHIKKKNNLDELKEVNKLSLKERRQKVINELKKESLNLEELDLLLLMDNTNESLLYKYFESVNKNNSYDEIERFSYFISPSKINELKNKLTGKNNFVFRKITNKEFFFQFLSTIKEKNENTIDKKISIFDEAKSMMVDNNQPFDINFNPEAFYFHLSCLLVDKIRNEKEKDKADFTNYLEGLKNYISSLSNELDKYERKEYEEKKDLKKFYTIVYSIINYNYKNRYNLFQVPKILNEPNEEDINIMISMEIKEIKKIFGEKEANEFKKAVENKKIFSSIKNIDYIEQKIYIPEESYLYDYILSKIMFLRNMKMK